MSTISIVSVCVNKTSIALGNVLSRIKLMVEASMSGINGRLARRGGRTVFASPRSQGRSSKEVKFPNRADNEPKKCRETRQVLYSRLRGRSSSWTFISKRDSLTRRIRVRSDSVFRANRSNDNTAKDRFYPSVFLDCSRCARARARCAVTADSLRGLSRGPRRSRS